MPLSLDLPPFPQFHLHILLYKDVTNAPHIFDLLKAGKLEIALIKPTIVPSTRVLWAAALSSLTTDAAGLRVSFNVHSELVFHLSTLKNMREAYKHFSPTQSSTELLLAFIEGASPLSLDEVKALVEGTEILDVDQGLASGFSQSDAQKVYKVPPAELAIGTYEEAILNRVATTTSHRTAL